jgi:hypothetical protein
MQWRSVARQNGLTEPEINKMAGAFEHEGMAKLFAT